MLLGPFWIGAHHFNLAAHIIVHGQCGTGAGAFARSPELYAATPTSSSRSLAARQATTGRHHPQRHRSRLVALDEVCYACLRLPRCPLHGPPRVLSARVCRRRNGHHHRRHRRSYFLFSLRRRRWCRWRHTWLTVEWRV